MTESFRVRYTITTKPSKYRYKIIEERWKGNDKVDSEKQAEENNDEKFDSKKEFYVGAGTIKQITGFIPSYGHLPIRIMWVIIPRIFMRTYSSPLSWWLLGQEKGNLPFSFESVRYFAEPGESLEHQANRAHGRFRGHC